MDRQKDIEKMAGIIRADYKEWLDVAGCLPEGTTYYYECLGGAESSANKLINAGIGDVKRAVKEFADKLKEKLSEQIKMWQLREDELLMNGDAESAANCNVVWGRLEDVCFEIDKLVKGVNVE